MCLNDVFQCDESIEGNEKVLQEAETEGRYYPGPWVRPSVLGPLRAGAASSHWYLRKGGWRGQ